MKTSIAATKRTVQRHLWRRTKDNPGRVLVHVPDEYLARRDDGRHAGRSADARDGRHDDSRDGRQDGRQAGGEAELLARLSAVQAELVEMAQRLGAAENRADAAEAIADELRQDRDVWRARAERLTTAEGRA